MSDWQEADMTINGVTLTRAQVMTLRVGMETFASQLHQDGLGTDEVGKSICAGYIRAVDQMRVLMGYS